MGIVAEKTITAELSKSVSIEAEVSAFKPRGVEVIPKSITENGTYMADIGYAYDPVTVDVPIPDGYLQPSGTLDVTENGTYDVTGFASTVVNTPIEDVTEYEDGLVTRTITGEYRNERVTSIGVYAFFGCMDLTTIDLPLVTDMGSQAFYNCYTLTTIDLPLLTSTGSSAFGYCEKLKSIDLPLVTKIASNTFYYCENLTTLILRSNTLATLSNTSAFHYTPISSGTGYIYVPDDLVEDYKVATNWATYADQIKPISELPAEEATE